MKRYIVSEQEMNRRAVRGIAEDVIRAHGDNNSIGTYDKFIMRMVNNWADSGQDEEFIREAVNNSFEQMFCQKTHSGVYCL